MILATNHGHGGTISHTFEAVRAVGFGMVRQEPHQDATDDEQYTLLDEFTLPNAPLLWWLVPGPPPSGDMTRPLHMAKLAASSGVPHAIEIANEPDLRWDGIQDITQTPARYADWVDALYVEIRTVNPLVAIIAGGVSGPNKRGLDFLEGARARDWPAEILCGVHRYPREDWPAEMSPHGAVMVAHKSFASREQELAALKDVIGPDRRLAIGEAGLHSSPRDVAIWQESWSYAQIADEALIDMQWWAAHGAAVYCWYQFGDGPDPNDRLHNFGVIAYDGSEKPVADSFRQFTQTT